MGIHFGNRLTCASAVTALLLLAPVAHAQEATYEGDAPMLASGPQLSIKIEPGLATALTSPQTDKTDLGMGANLQLLIGLNRYLAIGPTIANTTLPMTGDMPGSRRSWAFGAGARAMRGHDAPGMAISPWVSADLLYVRTGDLNRPGFDGAIGVSMPIDDMRKLWIGPFVRYSHIVQGAREGFDNRDAKTLTFGVGLELTSGLARRERRIAVVDTVPPPEPVAAPSDRDDDSVIDSDDNCPDVAGIVANAGCPPYERVVVKREKLEVREKIAFRWDSATIEESSYPALDEVVRALQDNRGFKVQIDGHASSDGNDAHNQSLSEQRAAAVLDYLVAKGVAKDRLISKGFSSSEPTQSNDTAEGREANRRVEFIVEFIIVNQGTTP